MTSVGQAPRKQVTEFVLNWDVKKRPRGKGVGGIGNDELWGKKVCWIKRDRKKRVGCRRNWDIMSRQWSRSALEINR